MRARARQQKLLNERCKKTAPASKNMCHLWFTIYLAKKMGKKLGTDKIL